MADITIPIGTSDPVNTCLGLPLFPTGAARAGVFGSTRSIPLLDVSATIFITRLKVSAYAQYAFGVCGPSLAFLFPDVKVQRSNVNGRGQLALTFPSQQLEAGGFIGLSAGAGLNLALQLYRPANWLRPWELSWSPAFTVTRSISIDFLGLLVDLIKYLLGRNSNNTFERSEEPSLGDILPGIQSYMFLDSTSGSGVQRMLRVTPDLVLPVNLVNYVPGFQTLNRTLSRIGGELSVGPSFHMGLPVTFEMESFTIEGALEGGARTATYGSLDYEGNEVTATGNTRFNLDVNPRTVNTNVRYETRFRLGVSVHFRVTVSKMFNFEVNTPSLDFSRLLFGTPTSPVVRNSGSVSTGVQNGCLLLPNITLEMIPASGNSFAQTGEPLKGHILLSTPYPGPTEPGNVQLTIEPPVPGFPRSLTIEHGSKNSDTFTYTFPNACLSTGDLANPTTSAPPSPTNARQTYAVTAKIPALSDNACSESEVTVSLNVENRYLRAQRVPALSAPGSSPPWDDLAGVQINAAGGNVEPKNLRQYAGFSCWFPYLPGETPTPIRVQFTLLDENRVPFTGRNVMLLAGSASVRLSPSGTLTFTPARNYTTSANVTLTWLGPGPQKNYSNRFFLAMDAGCAYGRTEVWLDVWNWS
jgi:hypothetical protein